MDSILSSGILLEGGEIDALGVTLEVMVPMGLKPDHRSKFAGSKLRKVGLNRLILYQGLILIDGHVLCRLLLPTAGQSIFDTSSSFGRRKRY